MLYNHTAPTRVPVVAESELFIGRQVVVLDLDGRQVWIVSQQLCLEVDGRLECSSTKWVVAGPVMFSIRS